MDEEKMKIALTADLHLGIRQFNNKQRWQDYLDAYNKLTTKVKKLQVDAFVIAGDIFNKSRPHPGIVRKFLKETSKVDCPVMLIRGNHDSPQILFEKYGGDILHLINDVSKIVYLNKKNPTLKIGKVNFIGVGYESYNIKTEIQNQIQKAFDSTLINVGIFHQLVDFPGVPEERADVSRSFLRNLGLNLILLGHFHTPYSEDSLFNPGSPEFWSFDQGECIKYNLDTGQIHIKPSRSLGFFVIDSNTKKGEFIKIKPARPMYYIEYKTKSFSEIIHLPKIRKHLQGYDIQGVLLKTVITGKTVSGIANLKNFNLKKPLIYTPTSMLKKSIKKSSQKEVLNDFSDYLINSGIEKNTGKTLASWIEKNKDNINSLNEKQLLEVIRKVITSKNKIKKNVS
jgi:DNA repair exonuclease SbcCD nuclease subunit